MRKVAPLPITREQLNTVLEQTYDDGRFLIGHCVDEGGNFLTGLCGYRSEFYTKKELQTRITNSPLEAFPYMPGFPDCLVIDASLYAWRRSFTYNRLITTEPPEGYIHLTDNRNPHYEIYFLINHAKKMISFRLGKKERTLKIIEASGYCWKPIKEAILCIDSKKLEMDFLDPFWNPIAVDIGHKVLQIKPLL